MTPGVRELVVLVLPATFAAGVYQISQFFYGFFASRLGEGAMAYLNYADRLNQLPPALIGTARGRLPDQPFLLRLFRLAARRGRDGLSELCRPAQPAAAVDHRHRARHRDPALDQPRHRPRPAGRGA